MNKRTALHESLETERLRLRPFSEADLDAYARICADAETMRYIGPGAPISRADAWRSMALLLGHWQLRGYGQWAVEDKRTGAFLGRIGLHNPEGWPVFEVGWLLDRARWGEGLATEGGRAAIQFAFERLKLERISSLIRPENRASIRVAEKLGMQFERETQLFELPVAIYSRSR
jgi:RimJ/RimL family protein N-acetyltransferase